MTNEELVAKIQQGETEYMGELWDQVRNYIAWSAERYLSGYPKHYEAYKMDCVHAGYFALVNAVRGYNRQQGKFLSYLKVPLKSSFREVIYSGRSIKQEKDPLNDALSLDEVMTASGGEAVTLEDFMCDKDQGEQTCFVISGGVADLEDADQWRTIHDFLEKGLKRSDNAGNKILLYMLNNDCKYSEAVTALYGEEAVHDSKLKWQKTASEKRLKRYVISRPKEVKKLGIDEIITQGGLRQYGLKRYKERIFTSAVEQIALNRCGRLN